MLWAPWPAPQLRTAKADRPKACTHQFTECSRSCRVQNLDIPRAGRVGAAHSWGAGRGGSGRRRVCSPRRQPTLMPSSVSTTSVLNASSEAQPSEILCKLMEEQIQRLTRGLLLGVRPLLIPCCGPVYRRRFVFVNPFHARRIPKYEPHVGGRHNQSPDR